MLKHALLWLNYRSLAEEYLCEGNHVALERNFVSNFTTLLVAGWGGNMDCFLT